MKNIIAALLLFSVFAATAQDRPATSDTICYLLDKKYKNELVKISRNINALNGLLQDYHHRCNHSEVYFKASLLADEIKSSYASSTGCAKYYYSINKMFKSIEYYEKSMVFIKNDTTKANIHLLIANIYYEKLNNFQKARENAQKSLDLIDNQAAPYFFMAELYANSKISKDEVLDMAKYWLAVDMIEKGINADPTDDNAQKATAQMAKYSCLFPSEKQIEQTPSMKENKVYRIGGWIGRTTICRRNTCSTTSDKNL